MFYATFELHSWFFFSLFLRTFKFCIYGYLLSRLHLSLNTCIFSLYYCVTWCPFIAEAFWICLLGNILVLWASNCLKLVLSYASWMPFCRDCFCSQILYNFVFPRHPISLNAHIKLRGEHVLSEKKTTYGFISLFMCMDLNRHLVRACWRVACLTLLQAVQHYMT